MADQQGCCLIITTGGTGPAARDITPEATESVCQKMMPGFGELMRQVSLQKVPTAILSRQNGRHSRSLPDRQPAKDSHARSPNAWTQSPKRSLTAST